LETAASALSSPSGTGRSSSYVTRETSSSSPAGSRSNARISSAEGAPPCWEPASHGPRASSEATNRPSPSSLNTAASMVRHPTCGLHSPPMSEQERTPRDEATFTVKAGLAEMLKGGVIMDVVTPEQAKIAEDAGAAAVMALERVPADIRRDGGVARMSDPVMIRGIQEAVTIPVMAKAR